MTNQEAIEAIKLAQSQVEWDYPMDYAVAFDMAIKALEQETTIKNDLVTLTFSKGILKYSCKDYVVYKRDWLRSHYGAEIDIMFGDSQYKEPTTKNDLGVDCISREQALVAIRNLYPGMPRVDFNGSLRKWVDKYRPYIECDDAIKHLPSVTPQEPKWIPVSERLPEDIKPVIVTWKNTDPKSYYQYIVGKHFIGTAHYKSGKWYWYSSVTEDLLAEYGKCDSEEFDEAIEVVAWMPLPQAYEPQESEDEG